jgi:fumarate reductase subunit D
MSRTKEPFLWALFSSGGMLTALAFPALLFTGFVAAPLGWLGPADAAGWLAVMGHPLLRLALFPLMVLALFHAAHRLRYTLYDGLQLYHLDLLIATLTYGTASALSLAAAVVLWGVG